MECVTVLLLVVIVLLTAVTSIGSRLGGRRRRRKLFEALAKRFNGTYDRGGFFSRPAVRMRYGDTWAIATNSQPIGPFPGPGLQVRIAWPHAHVRCEIASNLRERGTPEPRGFWPSVALDDFGHRYVVRGPDETDVRQLLTSGVRWQIDRLRQVGENERLYVLIRDGQIVVQKNWERLRGEEPLQFVHHALELYDQCMLAKASGIEFLNSDEAQTLQDVICKICGETITDSLVYCRRCKTPHHLECWTYAGICSVFGCRETEYLMPHMGTVLQRQDPPGDAIH